LRTAVFASHVPLQCRMLTAHGGHENPPPGYGEKWTPSARAVDQSR
jgi:hypothetical protein